MANDDDARQAELAGQPEATVIAMPAISELDIKGANGQPESPVPVMAVSEFDQVELTRQVMSELFAEGEPPVQPDEEETQAEEADDDAA